MGYGFCKLTSQQPTSGEYFSPDVQLMTIRADVSQHYTKELFKNLSQKLYQLHDINLYHFY